LPSRDNSKQFLTIPCQLIVTDSVCFSAGGVISCLHTELSRPPEKHGIAAAFQIQKVKAIL
jgi:hypothetical protein